ncbi:hypothetical protein L204_101263 [Cryptococcus depauperatus]|nr:hypothetical protein L204_03933 [Cryptococcus depauperatus CBS 7855]
MSNFQPSPSPAGSSHAAASAAEPIGLEQRKAATSPPIDPSKLNNQPASLPPQPENDSPYKESIFPPLHSPVDGPPQYPGQSFSPPQDSAYLDMGAPIELASHPTIAETGILASGGESGPKSGQLKRAEKSDGSIIKLGSLGGDGLKIKPPVSREDDE